MVIHTILANLIYDGESLHCIRSFTIQFRLVPEVNFCFFCQKNIENSGIFCFKCRNKFVLGGGQETLCIWGGSDKEHGPKPFRLKPLLKVNNSNNCTITDNYLDNYQDSIILRHQYH